MPAKLKLAYDLAAQIVELKHDGLCDAGAIAAIGVHQATFYRWLKEGENARAGVKRALCEELEKAGTEYKRCLLTTIKSAVESRAQYRTAAAWLLERKYPMEYGKMERKADEGGDATVWCAWEPSERRLLIFEEHSANKAMPIDTGKIAVDALTFPDEPGGEPYFQNQIVYATTDQVGCCTQNLMV